MTTEPDEDHLASLSTCSTPLYREKGKDEMVKNRCTDNSLEHESKKKIKFKFTRMLFHFKKLKTLPSHYIG